MKVLVKVYEGVKYFDDGECKKVCYNDVTGVEVKEISREEILKETDESCVDEYNEYAIITFADGDTATFRNSHVDIFRW